MARIDAAFRAPYAQPNGMQITDEGLWVADQVTDRCALIETENVNRYGKTLVLREIDTAVERAGPRMAWTFWWVVQRVGHGRHADSDVSQYQS